MSNNARVAPKEAFGWFLSLDLDGAFEMTCEPVAARWATPDGDVLLFREVGLDELIPLSHYMTGNEVFVGAWPEGTYPPASGVDESKRRLLNRARHSWSDPDRKISGDSMKAVA